MASHDTPSFTDFKQTVDVEQQTSLEPEKKDFNYSKRSQWLRAAVLGANDGLVSTASLMMGIGAVKEDAKAMILAGFAGLVAGACSMAIGEFVSVYSQLDIEMAQIKRDNKVRNVKDSDEETKRDGLPNPFQAAFASALAFSIGAMVPLLAAAFIRERKVRLGVVAGAASLALLVFGGVGAILGKAPVKWSCLRHYTKEKAKSNGFELETIAIFEDEQRNDVIMVETVMLLITGICVEQCEGASTVDCDQAEEVGGSTKSVSHEEICTKEDISVEDTKEEEVALVTETECTRVDGDERMGTHSVEQNPVDRPSSSADLNSAVEVIGGSSNASRVELVPL
ncbi:hypothetical protein IFM89_018365 [Coptis chinensis]|uniref:Uncharacterized protein n=1 Tax=Coptis chinensis TaxID=261450 RepID=A0A835LN86_9MAGN|nr:hypothetical protein IFM89_018365 [Coptis chinensis]